MAFNQKIALIITAVQYFFVFLAFVLAAALVGKANSVNGEYEEEGNYYSYSQEYAFGVPSWMTFPLFVGIFGLLSLGAAFFVQKRGQLDPRGLVGIQFLNWVFFLSAFALLGNAVSVYSPFCTIAFGDIYVAYCALPRATLGIDVLCWLITTLALGVAILNLRGTNLPSYMGARDIPPHQAQAVDDRYEMGNEMKHTGTT